MTREIWKSAGMQLLEHTPEGWLGVTPEFVRAFYMRPEIQPIDESCDIERALHGELIDDPLMDVSVERLRAIADVDTQENYRMVLAFRDCLVKARTIEGAYLALMHEPQPKIPPLFIDQLVHLIACNMLGEVTDPIRARAGEILFRTQNVSTDDGRVMLADEETVDMHAKAGKQSGQGQLLNPLPLPLPGLSPKPGLSSKPRLSSKTVELDVLTEDNADIYWARSDRFDTVVDFRFGQPALDAFARVIETWVGHMMQLDVEVQPLMNIDDSDWRWHIGLDVEATRLLNLLYNGKTPAADDLQRIVALFDMRISDERNVIEEVRGKPVYLGLAMDADSRVKMKPQNLLHNLPLVPVA